MTTVTFDTLEYSEILQESGVPREQADAMAKANAKALQDMVKSQELATKQDLELGLAKMQNNLDNSIATCKHDILKWVMGMIIAEATLSLGCFAIVITLILNRP